jgi:hypothetical protein
VHLGNDTAKWIIEGLFAEARQFHGLRRARYRRLKKVSIQALMTAMTQNIKRIIKQLPNIYRLLRKYQSFCEKILKIQNHLNCFRKIPKFFLLEAVSA